MTKTVVGYLTPDAIPEESHCRVLRIPADVTWLSTFMGALLPLADPASWQKYGALTEQEAADEALNVIWDAYNLASQECPLDVRQNEDSPCILEKNDGSGWVEFANLQLCPPLVVIGADGTPYVSDDGGETYHPAAVEALPRVPVEGQDTKCLGAANGTAAMTAFYAQVASYFADDVLLLVALGGIIALILALLGLPLALGAAITAFTELWGVFSSFFADDFDSDKQDIYRCILFCHSTLVGDVVTYDYDSVLGAVDELWTPVTDFNVWTAIHYLLVIIGNDGLQRAGATTSVTEANCSDCADCPSGECYQQDYLESEFTDRVHAYGSTVYTSGRGYTWGCESGSSTVNMQTYMSENDAAITYNRVEADIETDIAGYVWTIYGVTNLDIPTHDQVVLGTGSAVLGAQIIGADVVDVTAFYGLQIIISYPDCDHAVDLHVLRIFSTQLADADLVANC